MFSIAIFIHKLPVHFLSKFKAQAHSILHSKHNTVLFLNHTLTCKLLHYISEKLISCVCRFLISRCALILSFFNVRLQKPVNVQRICHSVRSGSFMVFTSFRSRIFINYDLLWTSAFFLIITAVLYNLQLCFISANRTQ